MKIAILHRIKDPYTLSRIKVFLKAGHEVISIVFPDKGTLPVHEKWNIVKLSESVLYHFPFAKRLIYRKEIEKLLNHYQPSVFFFIGAFNLFYASVRTKDIIKIVENQGSDVLLNPKQYIFYKWFYKRYYSKVQGIIQDSEISRVQGIKYGAIADPKFNKVFQNGIDFRIFNTDVPKGVIRERYKLVDRPIILHTRSLLPLYNIDILLNAIKEIRETIPEIVLIFTGYKESLPLKMIKFIDKNHLDNNILFVGFQDHDTQLNYFYSDADVVVSIPSSDSSPYAVYESMATKTPVIVTDLPWIDLFFKKDLHLHTVPVRNVPALKEKIIHVIRHQTEVDLEDSFDIVRNKISMQAENLELLKFFNSLLKKV
jgi:1,2-diacylglycerol 3-alpha-glucosyltransferase